MNCNKNKPLIGYCMIGLRCVSSEVTHGFGDVWKDYHSVQIFDMVIKQTSHNYVDLGFTWVIMGNPLYLDVVDQYLRQMRVITIRYTLMW